MRAFRYTEHIERPREEVFAYMMSFATASRWRNLVRKMEITDSGPPRAGAPLLITMDLMGKTARIESELWCYEPPVRFGQRNTRGGVTGVFEYVLEPVGAGTRVSFTCDLRPHGLMWLALPWLLRSSRRYRNQLATLKKAIEGESERPSKELSS